MKKITFPGILKLTALMLLVLLMQCNKIEDPFFKYELTIENITPTGGPEGTPVTISGSGFSTILNENSVKFNGKEAAITKATSTYLIAEAPADGTTGVVSVTVNGKTVEGPVFTYLATNQPQIISISPEVGWDYTLNAVTIFGENFGDDQNKVSVTFDGQAASLQSFSDTKLIVSPPTHEAGKVKVKVTVDGKASNEVEYTYQLKPVITNIFSQGYDPLDHREYFLVVKNLAPENAAISLTINGHVVKIDSVFRQGTDEYNLDPVGAKLITDYYVDQSVGYVSAMDFVVESHGLKSDPFSYINSPRILDFISINPAHGREVQLGDTVIIDGMYLGTKNQTSAIQIWDSTYATHYTPDPQILSWSETQIKIILPETYPVPGGKHSQGLILKENGKEERSFVRIIKPCPKLDEVYTGEYQYPNQTGQPYGIQLFPDGTMDFSSSYDDYAGTYTFDCNTNEVTMDFAGHGVIVKAIRESNALTHFTFIKSGGFDFLTANLNTTWDQNLDGTIWSLNPPQGNSTLMSFTIGKIVSFDQGQNTSTYNRLAGTIRFTLDGMKYFATISQNNMEGAGPFGNWTSVKQ